MRKEKEKEKKEKILTHCPYCQGKTIVKSGVRKKKHEAVQIYYCKNCEKKFVSGVTKNLTYPLRVILEAITNYNSFNSLEEAAQMAGEKYGLPVSAQNVNNWLKGFKEYLPFARMRDYIAKKYDKRDIFVRSKLFHGQIYDFIYHRAKLNCILDEFFKHQKFKPLQSFLEIIDAECPHQIFQESSKRASEYKNVFNLDQVKITPRPNFAVKMARLVIQTVLNNKLRHEVLQNFMLVNDSVTVATELPILLDKADLDHYKNTLKFVTPLELAEGEVITGHIDIVQVRNGAVHILDYKPSAKKVKPLEQLTIYALALSRLTGLKLFHFKCAWFDENDYFEFYPLHVVMKKKKNKAAVR
ncbi:MAG: PD-(D/E)XK nuclease family protein [Candidatus Pacebacteria bacterium]|nr:PD-(D/E)XK nuclease family protein [Candidatus Paceibacterota bacterium]